MNASLRTSPGQYAKTTILMFEQNGFPDMAEELLSGKVGLQILAHAPMYSKASQRKPAEPTAPSYIVSPILGSTSLTIARMRGLVCSIIRRIDRRYPSACARITPD